MRKQLNIFLFFVLSVLSVNAQERISPLNYNSSLFKPSNDFVKKTAQFDDLYIYKFDTLNLPFLDDFSSDKFTPISKPGDVNVVTNTFYQIEISGVPDLSGSRYVDDTTYLINITKNSDGDLIKDSIPNPVFKATIYDLLVYPPAPTLVDLWIDTTYIDSLWNIPSPDYKFVLNPDYVQDSLKVYEVNPLANSTDYVWKDRYVWRNFTRGINPPSVGLATFDGIDDAGLSYNLQNINQQGLADELTSKALWMGSHLPVDSVWLSFFYQFQGNGNAPDPGDSLVLQFWSPLEMQWNSIWKKDTGSSTTFTQVMIPIKDVKYFEDGFQFRFKNYGTLSGAVDHWHVDYIYINNNRTFDDTNQADLAFRYNIKSLLTDYSSMPWEHYKASPSGKMTSEVKTVFFNNNSTTEAFQNHTLEVLYNSVSQTIILGPASIPDFIAQSELVHTYNPSVSGYSFDPTADDLNADFEVKSYFKHVSDFNPNNDTIHYTQKFYNYYGYDDNTPEGGYYVLGDNVSIAQKITSVISDTLRAVQIHFEPVSFNAETESFYLTIWSSSNGEPDELLFQNIALSKPSYIGFDNDGFVEYALEQDIILPAGDFFIGIEQVSKVRINIGFDINTDNSDRIYYNVGGVWNNTSLSGTLMMRAVFKTPLDRYILSDEEINKLIVQSKFDVEVYPNPFNNIIYFNSKEPLNVSCFDVSGKLILSSIIYNKLNLSQLKNGIYLLQISNDSGEKITKKIIKN